MNQIQIAQISENTEEATKQTIVVKILLRHMNKFFSLVRVIGGSETTQGRHKKLDSPFVT